MRMIGTTKSMLLLTICALMLTAIGMMCLWGIKAPDLSGGGGELIKSHFVKQCLFLSVSLVAVALLIRPGYMLYRKISYLTYGGGIVVLILLLLFGREHNGTVGWIPVGPFTIQPSEFLKIAVVLALARYMMYQKNISSVRGLLGPFILTALPMMLVVLQPDLGSAIIFFPLCMAMLFTAGAKVRHLMGVFALSLMLAVFAFFFVLKEYQRDRIVSFVSPDSVSRDHTYQQTMAERATATGSLWGRGLGNSLVYSPLVPERHTDFIIPVIGEELGFVGCLSVLMLYVIFFFLSLRIAYESREPFGKLVIVGVVTMLYSQMLINVAMSTGVGPITGVTLPFISYGGSSLLSTYIAMALIINISRRWVPSFSDRDYEYQDGTIQTALGRSKWSH